MLKGDSDFPALKEFIKARAIDLGFCLCGVTTTEPTQNFSRYEEWISKNYHGEMNYLASEKHRLLRQFPALLVPWAKSIVVLAWPYRLNRSQPFDPAGQIAGYVGTIDYHFLLPQKIQELLNDLSTRLTHPLQSQFFCDSAPLLERELAVRAGLGWIGRNSCLISPKYGSALLLAELFLDLELPPDQPFIQNLCGNCQRCVNTCPTNCILQNDNEIDARLCLSTLTIENKTLFSQTQIQSTGNHLFGCDVCQAVCPWNRNEGTQANSVTQLTETEMLAELALSDAEFKNRFQSSAILRTKRRGWVRNLCAVLTNLKSINAFDSLVNVLASDKDPLCRASAATALASLFAPLAIPLLQKVLTTEPDPLVVAEIEGILSKNSLKNI